MCRASDLCLNLTFCTLNLSGLLFLGYSPRLSPATPTKATFDLEALQARCKQLQEELDKMRRAWNNEREEFHLRESKLEANLNATRKTNAELEVSLS